MKLKLERERYINSNWEKCEFEVEYMRIMTNIKLEEQGKIYIHREREREKSTKTRITTTTTNRTEYEYKG